MHKQQARRNICGLKEKAFDLQGQHKKDQGPLGSSALGVKMLLMFSEKLLCKNHNGSNMISHCFLLDRTALFLSCLEIWG